MVDLLNRVLDANRNETGDINLISNGYFRIVNIKVGGNVVITNSRLSAETAQRNYVNDSQDPRGRAGKIEVTSRTGEIKISNSSLSTTTGSSKADPGNILLTAQNGKVLIQDNSKITNTIEDNSSGINDNSSPKIEIKGRSVEILGKSDDISNFSLIDTRTSGIGKGADVIVTAISGGVIRIENSTIDASTHKSATGGGGNISLNADSGGSISLTRSTLFTDTFSSGKGGNIEISAENGSISLNSFLPLETKFFDGKATLVATVNPDASGTGGDMNLKAKTVVLENGAKIETQTAGTPDPSDPNKNAQAGNITVNVQDSVTMSGQSELNAKTTGSANAGSVKITANKLRIKGASKATATSEGSGKAEDITIVGANSVLLSRSEFTDFREVSTPGIGLLAEATKKGGTAGKISITTDDLRVENGAAVTVRSPEGQGGNVVIRAKGIFLDNGALLATTAQRNNNPGDGSNIILLGKETTDEAVDELGSLIEEGKLGSQGKKSLPGSPLHFIDSGQ
ncbi:MAG: hypothetical protein V7K92_09495 [Nostoc sp.]|uniref:hypothetical protein n=1 Tax=Nostoc sp. TaxID=1180 RepID=UPI002FF09835